MSESSSNDDQQRGGTKRTRGAAKEDNTNKNKNDNKSEEPPEFELIPLPEVPVYKKRGPKPKHIREAEAAYAKALAARKGN